MESTDRPVETFDVWGEVSKRTREKAKIALVELSEAVPKKRGGARPGAGRPRGSTKYPGGRQADAAMCFRVTSEFKARFDAQARAAGMNGTEYLKSLVENAARIFSK